jgi:hypothetical protein
MPASGVVGMSVSTIDVMGWTASRTIMMAGSVSTPSLGFISDTGTGFYRSAANEVSITISGGNLATFKSTGLSLDNDLKVNAYQIGTQTLNSQANSVLFTSATNSLTGTGCIQVVPSTAGWSAGGVAKVILGDTNYQVIATNGTGLTLKNTGTLSLPTSSDTLIGRATTDVLTNKDLTSATNSFPRSFTKLTTTYRFYNNVTLTSGATNNVVLQGNGTPAIPISASAVLVTIFGTYSADNAYVEACAGGGLATVTSSHTLYGQAEGGTRAFAHTALIILNNSDGSVDIRVNGGNATSVDASVLAYIY